METKDRIFEKRNIEKHKDLEYQFENVKKFNEGHIKNVQEERKKITQKVHTSSLSVLESIISSKPLDKNLAILTARNRHEARKNTLIELEKKQKKEVETEKLNDAEYKNLKNKLSKIEKKIEQLIDIKKKVIQEKSNIAKECISDIPDKIEKSISLMNEKIDMKLKNYTVTLKKIEKARNKRKRSLNRSLSEAKQFNQTKMERSQLNISKTKKLNAKNLVDMERGFKNRVSSPPINMKKANFLICKEAQLYNLERIKRIKQTKRLRIMEKFENLQKRIEDKKQIEIIFNSEKRKREFEAKFNIENQIKEKAIYFNRTYKQKIKDMEQNLTTKCQLMKPEVNSDFENATKKIE